MSPGSLTAKFNRIVLSKKRILNEKNALKKHNAHQAQVGAQLSAKLEECEAKLTAARNELLQMMPLKLALQELKEKNEKLTNSLTSQISDLRTAKTSAASMQQRKMAAEREAEDLREELNKLSRELAACKGDRDRQKKARLYWEEQHEQMKRHAAQAQRPDEEAQATHSIPPQVGGPDSHSHVQDIVHLKNFSMNSVFELNPAITHTPTSTPTPTTGINTNLSDTTDTVLGTSTTSRNIPSDNTFSSFSKTYISTTMANSTPPKPLWACLPRASTPEGDECESVTTYNSEDYEHHHVLSACNAGSQHSGNALMLYPRVFGLISFSASTSPTDLLGQTGILAPLFEGASLYLRKSLELERTA